MAKTNEATAATIEVAAAETTPQETATETKTAEPKAPRITVAGVAAKMGLRLAPLKRGPKAAKETKTPKHLLGATIDVATLNYTSWHRSGDKWDVDELINGTDKTVLKKARFRQDEKAIIVNGEGLKTGGFVSAAPEHVDEVVAALRKWETENLAKPMFDTFENEEALITAITEDKVRLESQFTILEHFVTVQPKPRKERTKKATTETDTVADIPVESVVEA